MSASRALLRLVAHAYAHLPAQRLTPAVPLELQLRLLPAVDAGRRGAPPRLFSGAGLLGSVPPAGDSVLLDPAARKGLVLVCAESMRSPYHVRYELIEFAVLTLAARAQQLVPLHGACVARRGTGVLLMGASGAGKSTLSLLCALAGWEVLSEDSVFVQAATLRATGTPNFLHVCADSLRFVDSPSARRLIRRSPTIRRRSGVQKFEVDLRQPPFRLVRAAPTVGALVFLSARASRRLVRSLDKGEALRRLEMLQGYATAQPAWRHFARRLRGLELLEMRRGAHPQEGLDALDSLFR